MNPDLYEYNKLVNEYKEYYFNVYSFLISKGWVVFEEDDAWYNSRGQLWTEYLLSPRLNELYKIDEEIRYQEWTKEGGEYQFDIFDLIIENSRSIVPPHDFVSNIDKNANIKDLIQDFYDYQKYFNKQENILLINKGWSLIELEDIETYWGTDDDLNEKDTLYVYVSPQFKKGFINKNNAYKCLRVFPNYVANSNIWWNYDQVINK